MNMEAFTIRLPSGIAVPGVSSFMHEMPQGVPASVEFVRSAPAAAVDQTTALERRAERFASFPDMLAETPMAVSKEGVPLLKTKWNSIDDFASLVAGNLRLARLEELFRIFLGERKPEEILVVDHSPGYIPNAPFAFAALGAFVVMKGLKKDVEVRTFGRIISHCGDHEAFKRMGYIQHGTVTKKSLGADLVFWNVPPPSMIADMHGDFLRDERMIDHHLGYDVRQGGLLAAQCEIVSEDPPPFNEARWRLLYNGIINHRETVPDLLVPAHYNDAAHTLFILERLE